jgi:mono/diheme cytochrome c family protein
VNESKEESSMRIRVFTAGLALLSISGVAAAEVDPKTERTFKASCQSCHGPDGKGQTEQGKKLKVPDFTSADWQKAHTDEELKKAIAEGVKDGKEIHKKKYPPAQVDALLAYVRAFGAAK